MEEVKIEKSKKEFKFRLVAGTLFGLSWLILIGLRLSSEISLRIPFFLSLFLTVLFVISIFGKKLYSLTERLREKEKTPEPISNEELEKIEEEEVSKMWNYIERGKPSRAKTHTIRENIIYERQLNLYRDVDFGKKITNKIIILINATYPKIKRTILPIDCDKKELEDAIDKIAKGYSSPDLVETETGTDEYGKPKQVTRKIVHEKKSEESAEAVT